MRNNATNPSHPDQTSTSHQPNPAPQPEPHILYELTPHQFQTIGLLPKDDNIPLTSALRETFVDELTQCVSNEEHRDLQEQGAHASPQTATA